MVEKRRRTISQSIAYTPRTLSLMWKEQDGFGDGLGCFHPTVWFAEDACHVGWYGVVIFYHLSQGKQV